MAFHRQGLCHVQEPSDPMHLNQARLRFFIKGERGEILHPKLSSPFYVYCSCINLS